MKTTSLKQVPVHFWIGIALIACFWYLNWSLTGLRTHWGFFPLWLGYCLTVDGLVFYQKGSSFFTRNKSAYFLLFLISAPTWWLFEFFNYFTQNWHYSGREFFSDIEYAILATLSFSTVIPAVFGTAELVSTAKWNSALNPGKKLIPSRRNLRIFLLSGIVMLILIFSFPRTFYMLIWASVLFIVEPLNVRLKNRTLFSFTAKGDWRLIVALAIGCLICGFFWEMWNYYSYPKWIYDVPGVNFLHVFEMPLLGYIGYIPFALELYAVYNLITGIFNLKKVDFER